MGQPLAVRVLEVTEYPPSGWGYSTRSTAHPTWEQIVAAARALNHHTLPFLFIGLGESCQGENCFSVLGGPNGYAITAANAAGEWFTYCDPSHIGGEVRVWTSDRGYYPPERSVTYDLGLVLRVTRHYAERGQLDPSVDWE